MASIINKNSIPFNFKEAFYILAFVVLLIYVMVAAKSFLIPLCFGAVLAMLFLPLIHFLQRKINLPFWVGIFISVLILLIILGGLITVLGIQVNELANDWPRIQNRIAAQERQLERIILQNTSSGAKEQIDAIRENVAQNAQENQFRNYLLTTFGTIYQVLTSTFLAIIYMIMFLLVRKRLKYFVIFLVPNDQASKANQAISDAQKVSAKYLTGRLLLMCFLFVVYVIGFMSFGLKYSIPIALLTTALTIIPYVGVFAGGIIVLAMAIATGGDFSMILGLVGVMVFAQVIESNVLEPWIVGKQVALNPLVTFTSIIGFSFIWGPAGMILAVPIVGMIKELGWRTKGLQKFSFLVGDQEAQDLIIKQ